MELRRVAMYASVLLYLGIEPAIARTLLVDDDVAECPKAQYNTIQQAVAAAQPGDKILVCPGLYFGTVVVATPDLRIEAKPGSGEVVLQGTGAEGELGFVLLNTTGVVLQGFTVQGFGRAQIRIQGGRDNTVRKNVTRAAVFHNGIQVTGSSTEVASGNIVEYNTSYDNERDGIYVGVITDILPFHPASDNIVRFNETFNNRQFGINLLGSGPGNLIFANRVHNNAQRGILAANLSHAEIKFNHVFANGLPPNTGMGVGVGISVITSNFVTVSGNRTEGNGTSGILLGATSANNVVTHNLSHENAASGVQVQNAHSSVVEKNLLSRNLDGVRILNNAAANSIQSNFIWQSGRDGIRAEAASSNNTIERNVIFNSVEHDAHDDSNGIGTAGTANFWIDNHCETENRLVLCDH